MSSNLEWKPVIKNTGNYLSSELKFALRRRYDEPVHIVVNLTDIPYLNGLLDAGIDDAEKVIDAINKHGQVEIDEVY